MASSLFSTQVFWRQMRTIDLIRFCLQNRESMTICRQPATWKFLLQRDFNIFSNPPNPIQVYFKQLLESAGKLYQKEVDYYRTEEMYTPGKTQAITDDINKYTELSRSVRGLSDHFKKIFGNPVGKAFYQELERLAHVNGVNKLEILFSFFPMEEDSFDQIDDLDDDE